MHIISPKTLREFWIEHPQAETALRSWVVRTQQADWRNFVELRGDFPAADLAGRFIVFNIGGNKYRLIVRVEFWLQKVFIRQVLTHSDYNKEKWKDDPWF